MDYLVDFCQQMSWGLWVQAKWGMGEVVTIQSWMKISKVTL